MTRVALVSFALTLLTATSGCERKPTTPPEAPAAKTDFAPEEEYAGAGVDAGAVGGGGAGAEEETAPGLNSR